MKTISLHRDAERSQFGLEYIQGIWFTEKNLDSLRLKLGLRLGDFALVQTSDKSFDFHGLFSQMDMLHRSRLPQTLQWGVSPAILVIDAESALPVVLTPIRDKCFVDIELKNIPDHVKMSWGDFRKLERLEPQLLDMDQILFVLAKVANDLAFDLEKRRMFKFLDHLAFEIRSFWDKEPYGRIFKKFETEKFHFDAAARNRRMEERFQVKSRVYHSEEDLLASLWPFEMSYWKMNKQRLAKRWKK